MKAVMLAVLLFALATAVQARDIRSEIAWMGNRHACRPRCTISHARSNRTKRDSGRTFIAYSHKPAPTPAVSVEGRCRNHCFVPYSARTV